MKYKSMYFLNSNSESPPSRGAWIEMAEMLRITAKYEVAPLAGGVD